MMFPTRTILHATDFSDCSRYAFHVAGALAQERGARLIVLHVNPRLGSPAAYDEALEQLQPGEYKDWLWKILRRLQLPDSKGTIEHRLVDGEPAREILNVAEETGCDVIVMGTHGRSGLARVILGSVTEPVLRKAPCPVVTVKMPSPAPTKAPATRTGATLVGAASSGHD